MIFLSHNSKDKPLIREIAKTLRDVFGQDKVFYDEWTIQPGDGIIDKMNEGLANCTFFFFFISENSLQSNMVKLEWQNALMRKTNSNIDFIPVKIDESHPPAILLQTVYIDLFTYGLEVAKRQIIDVINGKNTFQDSGQDFSNIIGIINKDETSTVVEFRAEYYMEPQSRFLIILNNKQDDFKFEILERAIIFHQFHPGTKFNDIDDVLGFKFWSEAPTSPGFPFTIRLIPNEGKKIDVLTLAHEKTQGSFSIIPFVRCNE